MGHSQKKKKVVMGRSTIKQQSQRVLGMKPFFPSYNNPNLFLPKKQKKPKFRPYKENKGPKSSRALRNIGPMFGVILPCASSFLNLYRKKILFSCQWKWFSW